MPPREHVSKTIALDLPADNKLATLPTRCFIAPRRELEILRGGDDDVFVDCSGVLNYLINGIHID